MCLYTHIYIYIYIYMAKNIGTLGKYDQRRLWKIICIVNPFIFFISQKSNLSLDNNTLVTINGTLLFNTFWKWRDVTLYGWMIQTWPLIRFLTDSVTYWFVICWYLKESMMPCLNKMFRTSSRNIGPQLQKYSSIFNCTHGVLFIPVFTKPILSVCC